MSLILASTSPRRREILALLGLPFEVVAPSFEEPATGERPLAEDVLEFAVQKAASVARERPGHIVIGSDTMISLGREKFGKPRGAEDAKRMLRCFSGKVHHIYTAVAIIDHAGGPGDRTVERVAVKMRPLSQEEIDRYVALGESSDKAGAYAIQGAGRQLVESVQGDYLAAVGMPLKPIARYLRARSIEFPCDIEKLYADGSFLHWRRL